MGNLVIESKMRTPSVNFNVETNVLEIKGNSYDDRMAKFYEPLIEWVTNYLKIPPPQIILNFYFTYCNSSTKKYLYNMLKIFIPYQKGGGKLTVNWYYEEDYEEMADMGHLYSDGLKMPFNFISVPDEE